MINLCAFVILMNSSLLSSGLCEKISINFCVQHRTNKILILTIYSNKMKWSERQFLLFSWILLIIKKNGSPISISSGHLCFFSCRLFLSFLFNANVKNPSSDEIWCKEIKSPLKIEKIVLKRDSLRCGDTLTKHTARVHEKTLWRQCELISRNFLIFVPLFHRASSFAAAIQV